MKSEEYMGKQAKARGTKCIIKTNDQKGGSRDYTGPTDTTACSLCQAAGTACLTFVDGEISTLRVRVPSIALDGDDNNRDGENDDDEDDEEQH